MIFDNGITQISFDPIGIQMGVSNPVELAINTKGAVIAASAPQGMVFRRRREIELRLTTAQRTAIEDWFQEMGTTSFLWTDTQGRVWDAWWGRTFSTQETATTADGWHRMRVSLVLDGINDDTGRAAYSNTDVSQMSIQKSGAAVLNFPLAYRSPATKNRVYPNRREQTGQFVAIDPNRRTERTDLNLSFSGLDDDFIIELEDYFVETLEGSTHPFALDHFRDVTANYRWQGDFNFSMSPGLIWGGTIALREDL